MCAMEMGYLFRSCGLWYEYEVIDSMYMEQAE